MAMILMKFRAVIRGDACDTFGELTTEISEFSIEQTFEFMSMDIKDYGSSEEGGFRRESMTCRKRKEKIDFVCAFDAAVDSVARKQSRKPRN